MGRLTGVTVDEDASLAGHGAANDTNLATSYGYDALGRTTDTTDPAGNVTHLAYDRPGGSPTPTSPTTHRMAIRIWASTAGPATTPSVS